MTTHQIQIHPIPILKDNYVWAIIDASSQQVIVVDPGDAAPIRAFISDQKLILRGVLITHHHWDHTNGLIPLFDPHPVPTAGPASESIQGITMPVSDGDTVTIPHFPISFSVFDIPGHTLGHVAYLTGKHLFCGDTLFAAGCGRLFEGTADQLFHSLQKIAALPDDTFIYCTHEYTLNNLRFAATVEPTNQDIQKRIEIVSEQRHQAHPSLPSILIEEKKTNPFLRCHRKSVREKVEEYANRQLSQPVDVFTWLRKWKDQF